MGSQSRPRAKPGAESVNSKGEDGYAPSGLSQWTRTEAGAARKPILLDGKRKKKSAAGVLIEQEDLLAELERKLRTASADERPKLLKSIGIKKRFIARLQIERDGM
jgi:hypothetical protein